MKTLLVIAGLAGILAATSAHATMIYDNYDGETGTALFAIGNSFTPNHPWVGASFQASAGTVIDQVNLDLAAATPTDGGSLLVYIVPDDGVNGASLPHSPTYSGSPGNTWSVSSTLTGATLISTIADSSLSSTASLQSVTTSYSVGTSKEYWIMVLASGTSTSGEYELSQVGEFGTVGTTNQIDDFVNNGHTKLSTSTMGTGDFMLSIAIASGSQPTPEPSSLALVGVSLFGLGWLYRRRRAMPPAV